MIHRVIPLGTCPVQILNHIRAAGCIIRLETTATRGPVAFVGAGRVWAVGTLRDVKPATKGKAKDGKEPPQGFIWCFSELQEVENVKCAGIESGAMFLNGDAWEPQMLQASTQNALNRLIGPEKAVMGIPITEPEVAALAMPPDYQTEPPVIGVVLKAGQLGMVF